MGGEEGPGSPTTQQDPGAGGRWEQGPSQVRSLPAAICHQVLAAPHKVSDLPLLPKKPVREVSTLAEANVAL